MARRWRADPAAGPGRVRWGVVVAAAALLWGAGAWGAKRADGVRRWDEGGIIVYALEVPGAPQLRVSAVFRAGMDLDPPERPGVAEVTAAVVRQAVEGAGVADGGAAVTAAVSTWTATLGLPLPTRGAASSLGMLAEALASPPMDAQAVALARDALIIRRDAEDRAPQGLARRALEARLLGPSARGRPATAQELARIEAADVDAFHRRAWVRNSLWLALAGQGDNAALSPAVGAAFAAWQRQPMQLPPPAPIREAPPGWERVESPRGAAAMAGGLSGGRWDPDRHAGAVLTAVLDARLRAAAGDAGAASRSGEPGLWWAWIAGDGASQETLEAVLDEVAAGGPGDQEIIQARDQLVARASRAVRSPGDVVARYASQEAMGYPGDQWRKDLILLERVRPSDVRRLARRRLAPARRCGVLAIPPGAAAPGGDAHNGGEHVPPEH